MNVTEKKVEGLTHHFEVKIPGDVYNKQLEATLTKLGEQKSIPGFRKGKVPLAVLKQKFEKEAAGEALERSVQSHIEKVLEEKKLEPAVRPNCKVTKFDEDQSITFDMEVEVMPEIKIPDFKKFKLEKLKMKIDEKKAIEDIVGRMQDEDLSGKEVKDRGAKDGDVLALSYTLTVNKEEKDKANFFICRLGSKGTLDDFQKGLKGLKAGDKHEFSFTFPKDYGGEDIQGQKGTFAVEIKEVREAGKADDEFAKKRGFKDMDDLKKAVVSSMEKDSERRSFVHLKRHTLDALDKACQFDVPPTMVENEFKAIWDRLLQESKGEVLSKSEKEQEELKKEYNALALRRVRLGMVLNKIAEEQKVEVTNEEIQQGILQEASKYPGREKEFLDHLKKNPGAIQHIRAPLFEDKVIQAIIDGAAVKEKELDADAFHGEVTKVTG